MNTLCKIYFCLVLRVAALVSYLKCNHVLVSKSLQERFAFFMPIHQICIYRCEWVQEYGNLQPIAIIPLLNILVSCVYIFCAVCIILKSKFNELANFFMKQEFGYFQWNANWQWSSFEWCNDFRVSYFALYNLSNGYKLQKAIDTETWK